MTITGLLGQHWNRQVSQSTVVLFRIKLVIKSDQTCLFQPQKGDHCTLLKGMVVWCIELHTYGSLGSNPWAFSRVVFHFFNPIKLASLALPLPLTTEILLPKQ